MNIVRDLFSSSFKMSKLKLIKKNISPLGKEFSPTSIYCLNICLLKIKH